MNVSETEAAAMGASAVVQTEPGGAAATEGARTTTGEQPNPLTVTKFLDPLRIPPLVRPRWRPGHSELTMTLRATTVRFHSQLPPSRVWAYDGHVPGPTIEVRRGQLLRVAWVNEIEGPFPVEAVEVPGATTTPGYEGGEPLPDVAALPPFTVVHLHGARTGGGNDGWADNAVLPGLAQLAEYPNDQQATALWYHDHAMAITRLNVMSGLAGMYLIRDDEEEDLGLPGGRHELPLVVADRNFTVDVQGRLTGQLLHKVNLLRTEPTKVVIPFSGPFTTVNGVIWPHCKVEPRWYRIRLLNASNSRIYGFRLADETGADLPGALHQIGTDSGLLPAPLALDEITLAPAERADVLIDFSAFRGRNVRLVNRIAPPNEPGTTVPNPDVMEFRVGSRPVHDRFRLPETISSSYVRLTHDHEHSAHRWVVLTPVNPDHLEIWEMVEDESLAGGPFPQDGVIQVQVPHPSTGEIEVKTLRRVSRRFDDAVNFFAEQDTWEQWSMLNLSPIPITHPMHIHLIAFQPIERNRYDVSTFDAVAGGTVSPLPVTGPAPIDDNETGWKDVIRVDGGTLTAVMGRFGGGSGRFMYHCHILEHEDEGMMASFTVMPQAVMRLDPHRGGHGHGHGLGHGG